MGEVIANCSACSGEALLNEEHLENPSWICPHCNIVNVTPAQPPSRSIPVPPTPHPEPAALATERDEKKSVGVVVAIAIIIGIAVFGYVQTKESASPGGGGSRSGAYQVRYQVSAPTRIGTITWQNGNGDSQQDSTDSWKTWTSPTYTMRGGEFLYVSAQNARDGTITCQVIIDGVVAESNSSEGKYAICTASGTA